MKADDKKKLVGHIASDLRLWDATVTLPSGNNSSHSVMIARFPDGSAWELRSIIGPDLYKCRYVKCDHGMGLAGGGGCPGDPQNTDCPEFTTEYSKEGDDEKE